MRLSKKWLSYAINSKLKQTGKMSSAGAAACHLEYHRQPLHPPKGQAGSICPGNAQWPICYLAAVCKPFLPLLATSQNPLHLYLWIYLTACNLQNQEQEVPRCLRGEQAIPEHKQIAQGQWSGCVSSPSSASKAYEAYAALPTHSSGTWAAMYQAQIRHEAFLAFWLPEVFSQQEMTLNN